MMTKPIRRSQFTAFSVLKTNGRRILWLMACRFGCFTLLLFSCVPSSEKESNSIKAQGVPTKPFEHQLLPMSQIADFPNTFEWITWRTANIFLRIPQVSQTEVQMELSTSQRPKPEVWYGQYGLKIRENTQPKGLSFAFTVEDIVHPNCKTPSKEYRVSFQMDGRFLDMKDSDGKFKRVKVQFGVFQENPLKTSELNGFLRVYHCQETCYSDTKMDPQRRKTAKLLHEKMLESWPLGKRLELAMEYSSPNRELLFHWNNEKTFTYKLPDFEVRRRDDVTWRMSGNLNQYGCMEFQGQSKIKTVLHSVRYY